MREGRSISTQAVTRYFHAPVTLAIRTEPGDQWTVNCAVQRQSRRSGEVVNLCRCRESNTDPSVIQVVSYSLYGRTFFTKGQKLE